MEKRNKKQNKQQVETGARSTLAPELKEGTPHRQLPVLHSLPAYTSVPVSGSAFGTRRLALDGYRHLRQSGHKSNLKQQLAATSCHVLPNKLAMLKSYPASRSRLPSTTGRLMSS